MTVHGIAQNQTRLKRLSSSSSNQGASLVVQMVNNLPAMQETLVGSLGPEDPLEKRMVFLPGECHGQRSPWGHKESYTTE